MQTVVTPAACMQKKQIQHVDSDGSDYETCLYFLGSQFSDQDDCDDVNMTTTGSDKSAHCDHLNQVNVTCT